MLGAQSPQLAEALGELRTGKAVFGVSGGVHDLEALLTCPDGEGAAGVVAAGDGFGEEQSAPQPSSRRSFKMAGVGVALTAKYSR